MAVFQVSLEELLRWCRRVEGEKISQRMLFFDAPEEVWIHYVPRLLVLLEGSCEPNYLENGVAVTRSVQAPAFFFCARSGWLNFGENGKSPNKMLSFSYYPGYIRAMMIDFDGKTPPPTARDIFYHTSTPLSVPGGKLLELLESLQEAGDRESGQTLLPLLFELTLRDLQSSSLGGGVKMPKLWEQINTFLREHRDASISRSQVSKVFRISQEYVSQLCKKYTGESFSRLRVRYQLEHAENLLAHTRLSVDEIADRSGFSSANYFIRRFKEKYGRTPHVYRNETGLQRHEAGHDGRRADGVVLGV